MTKIILLVSLVVASTYGFSQNFEAVDKEVAYTKTINDRAQKIVAKIVTKDSLKAKRISTIVANQYRSLNEIHTFRNDQVKLLKAQADLSKDALNAEVKKLEDDANVKLDALHKNYLSALSKELSQAQVDQVKDGMTYDVLHVTYNGYNQMILNLTDTQKKQIMDWLIEAREHAMDAESSDKKHAWFGKYKGRINNYLSAAGYDLRKEGEEWEKRRKDKEAKSKGTQAAQ
jgi:hypothetical protein